MLPETYYVISAAAFGAAIGSFLNVCIYRLPAGGSVVRPGSACPRCGAPIQWYDNIPILSWIILRGRCRRCHAPISWQYPLVEATVAVLWGASVWWRGVSWDALAAVCFGTLLLGIAITDFKAYIIPDEFSLGGLAIGLVLALAHGAAGLGRAALGAAVGFAILFAVGWLGERALKKEAMGGGDIKMMAMVGAFVGWQGALLTIFLGALLGTVIFLPISLKTKRLVPFGIFLAAGAAATFVFGGPILAWYLRFLRVG